MAGAAIRMSILTPLVRPMIVMTAQSQILAFYARPGAMTSPGRHAQRIDDLPRDVAKLARAVQGLVVHEFMAEAYAVDVPRERLDEPHIRRVERLVDVILGRADA